MTSEAPAHWEYAREDLSVARHDLAMSPRNAATRAYYAAFHAVSALFAIEGRTFTRHSAIERAVHRDLVKSGRWSADLGINYSNLFKLRQTSDYDVSQSVTPDTAQAAIEAAAAILQAAQRECPELK